MRESSKKAVDGTKDAAAAIRDTGANIGIIDRQADTHADGNV